MARFARWLPLVLFGVPVLLAWATFRWVSLIPQIDQRFFFTSGSPIYRAHQKIDERYSGQDLLVVIAAGNDIASPTYGRRIRQLSDRLSETPGVIGVRSLAAGPQGLEDARESPLWRRLLLPEKAQASNLVLVVKPTDPAALIDGVQAVLQEAQAENFRLELAGVPYVVESIRRNLQRDFRTFNLAAGGVFALVILVLFRSLPILLGSLTACATAVFATLMAQQWLGGRIGLLTANIVTIAFVLTQSHVVFMSNNWRKWRESSATSEGAVRRAIANTITASLWCMATALLGFGSLLYVEAQPLRELGFGGAIATVVAFGAAYLIFPPFLLWARAPAAPVPKAVGRYGLWLPTRWVAAGILLLCLAVGAGALRLDTDPSLLEYFGADSDVRRSLQLVDRHGGSSPLNIAVRRKDGERLDNDESYDRMWKLQYALQDDPAVGTVLSLPVLMAEADRSPFAKLLTWNWLLDILSRPGFDRVAESFVNEARTEALFMLRMVEDGREERRTDVIGRLKSIVDEHGFTPALIGGIYALQGRLADLVADSLYEGLGALLIACTLIALVLTRTLWAGVAMALCSAAIPAVTLGLAGFLSIPFDIVVSPAINVAVGVAVDSMIHFGAAWRRARERGDDVRAAQREQAPGIIAFFVVVTAGFAIFLLSSFPPTQRFGLAVVIGTAIAAVMALWIFPGLLADPDEGPSERFRAGSD